MFSVAAFSLVQTCKVAELELDFMIRNKARTETSEADDPRVDKVETNCSPLMSLFGRGVVLV